MVLPGRATFSAATYLNLGAAYFSQERYGEAIAALEAGQKLAPDLPVFTALLGNTYALMGRRKDALAQLEKLHRMARSSYVSPFQFAVVHAALGEHQQALEYLERAYDERAMIMPIVNVVPTFAPLRGHPQFEALLRQMNFPRSPTCLRDHRTGIRLVRPSGASPA